MQGRHNLRDLQNTPPSHKVGFYLGIAGVALSAIGILLTILSITSLEKDIWLGLSGWLAAALVGIFLSIPLLKCLNQLSELHDAYNEILIQLNDAQTAHTQMTDISAFVISKTIRTATAKRKTSQSSETITNPEPSKITERLPE